MKTLIISTCKNKLHEEEFVRPVVNIVKKHSQFKVLHYSDIYKNIFLKYDNIIICGTALKDNEYIKNTNKFDWIKEIKNPILGICAGYQIICEIFESKTKEHLEIGLIKNIKILKKDIILTGENLNEVYSLHNFSNTVPKDFEIIAKNIIPQIIKKDNIYATIFHPEIRNKNIIKNFIKNGLQ